MDQHSFSTAFEKRLKPRIAADLGLFALGQRFNVDYVTPWGNLVELKIRKLSEEKNGHGFVMNKRQYGKIKERYLNGQTFFGRDGSCCLPKFSYLLLGYSSQSRVRSIGAVDEVIKDMNISNVFLMDHRFIAEHDKSSKESRFYRVSVEDLDKSIRNKKEVCLLNSRIDLKLAADGKYVSEHCNFDSYL